MKLVFALLLCGFSVSFASPVCDDAEGNKCSAGYEDVDSLYPKTEEELNKFCRATLGTLDCILKFIDRCPNTLHGFLHVSTELNRALYGKICEKDNPLRAVFLAKSQCIEKEEFVAERRCEDKVAIKDYCLQIDPVQKCVVEELNRVCGEDGKELYAELSKIKRAFKNAFCITE